MIVPNLDTSELAELRELQEVYELAASSGWKSRIEPLISSLVAEANEEMLGAVYATEQIKAALLTRWQQRVAVQRAILSYIGDCEARRTRILEEIEARRKESVGESDSIPSEAEYA